MTKNERIPLAAKSLGGTLYKPVEIPTADYPQGDNDADGVGQIAGMTLKDYHKVFYGTGVTASQAEPFYADRTRTAATIPKVLSYRTVTMRFQNPYDGFARATLTGTFTGAGTVTKTITVVGLISTRVYKWTSPPVAFDDVEPGGSISTSLNNLVRAITGGGTPGTDYGTGTLPNNDVDAANIGGNQIRLYSKHVGRQGNAMTASEDDLSFSWGTSGIFTGGGQPDIAAGSYLYTTAGVQSSNVSPFVGYLLENGTWTLVGSNSKLPVTSAASAYALALDAVDVNTGLPFALNYGNGLGVSAVTANDQDIVVSTGGSIRGQTISCRIHSAGVAFPPGGYLDLTFKRRAT